VHEAHLLRLSIDKAVTLLGWRPRWAVRETVRRTATWYRTFYERGEGDRTPGFMRESCLRDIADYQLA
jgi:CDP-glucose 4,6-dehydratase